jgi:hypothetical protein
VAGRVIDAIGRPAMGSIPQTPQGAVFGRSGHPAIPGRFRQGLADRSLCF